MNDGERLRQTVRVALALVLAVGGLGIVWAMIEALGRGDVGEMFSLFVILGLFGWALSFGFKLAESGKRPSR